MLEGEDRRSCTMIVSNEIWQMGMSEPMERVGWLKLLICTGTVWSMGST